MEFQIRPGDVAITVFLFIYFVIELIKRARFYAMRIESVAMDPESSSLFLILALRGLALLRFTFAIKKS